MAQCFPTCRTENCETSRLEAVKKSTRGRSPYTARVTNPPTSPTPRLISIDRQQILLRTVDVEKLIDEDRSARSVWELVGRLDLGLYHAQIEAVEGGAGRNHTDPQLLVSLWLYAYSRGISSAREVARQCEFEPGFQWLCGLQAISHRTLSGLRSGNKAAWDDLLVQVLGMLSAEGLISLERVTLDGNQNQSQRRRP